MDDRQKEGDRVVFRLCPICQSWLDDGDLDLLGRSDFSAHVYTEHADFDSGCFCGKRMLSQYVRPHWESHGGLEAHYMDYLMGVSKENQ